MESPRDEASSSSDLAKVRPEKEDQHERETLLLEMTRYYGAFVVGVVLVCVFVALAIRSVLPSNVEFTTLVVEQGNGITPLQQGTISQVVFHSQAVYIPAMRDLGVQGSPARLYERVDLRPVPGANALMVAGRDPDPVQARRLSAVTAQSF